MKEFSLIVAKKLTKKVCNIKKKKNSKIAENFLLENVPRSDVSNVNQMILKAKWAHVEAALKVRKTKKLINFYRNRRKKGFLFFSPILLCEIWEWWWWWCKSRQSFNGKKNVGFIRQFDFSIFILLFFPFFSFEDIWVWIMKDYLKLYLIL